MDQQNWSSYKRINLYLSDGQSTISLQNGFMLYFGFKSDIAPLPTFYNVSELRGLFKYECK